jgi:hypothetical protein
LVYRADSGDVDDQSSSAQPSAGRYCLRVLVTQVNEAICDPQDGSDCPLRTPELPASDVSGLTVGDNDLDPCPTPACADGVLDPGEERDDDDIAGRMASDRRPSAG